MTKPSGHIHCLAAAYSTTVHLEETVLATSGKIKLSYSTTWTLLMDASADKCPIILIDQTLQTLIASHYALLINSGHSTVGWTAS